MFACVCLRDERLRWKYSHKILLKNSVDFSVMEENKGHYFYISHSVVSDSLQPRGVQPTRFHCPSLSPGVRSNSCPLSRWCHPTISCSVTPFSSCHQSFPKLGPFPMSPLCIMAKVLELQLQHQFFQWMFWLIRMHWFDLLAVQETLKSILQHHSSNASILQHLAFFMVQLSHLYKTTGKTTALTIWIFVGKVMSLLFNVVWVRHNFSSRDHTSLNCMAAVTVCRDFGAQEKKSVTDFVSPSICHEVIGPDAMISIFWILSFKPVFSLSSFTFIRKAL